MRLLLIRPGASFSVQDVAFGWRDALRAHGIAVADFNYDDRLDFYTAAMLDRHGELRRAFTPDAAIRLAAKGILSTCYEFWPDVVLVVSGTFVPPDVLDVMTARGHRVVLLCTESPYEDDWQLGAASHVSTVLLNDPTNLDAFRARNPDTHYVPHAYDPRRHYPGPVDPKLVSDFAFVGSGFPSRVAFLEAVDFAGLDVVLAGQWQGLAEGSPLRAYVAHDLEHCLPNADTADIYRGARSSLNYYRREANDDGTALGWAIGPREVELAACGTFFLRDPRPESDALFPMLPTFTEPGEVRPLLDHYLAHDTERDDAARAARVAIEHRTFGANASWLLRHLDP